MPVKSNLEKRADYISISGDNDQIPCAIELNVTRSSQSTHSPESSLWQSDDHIDRHLGIHLHGIRHHKRRSKPREIRSGHRALVHLPISGHGGLQFRQHLAATRFDQDKLLPGEIVHILKAGDVGLTHVIRPYTSHPHDPYFTESLFRHAYLVERA